MEQDITKLQKKAELWDKLCQFADNRSKTLARIGKQSGIGSEVYKIYEDDHDGDVGTAFRWIREDNAIEE